MKSKDKFEDTNILRQLVILQREDLVLPAYIFINDSDPSELGELPMILSQTRLVNGVYRYRIFVLADNDCWGFWAAGKIEVQDDTIGIYDEKYDAEEE